MRTTRFCTPALPSPSLLSNMALHPTIGRGRPLAGERLSVRRIHNHVRQGEVTENRRDASTR